MNRLMSKLLMLMLIGWVLGGGEAMSQAELAPTLAATLPRSFEGARLGMAQDELSAVVRRIGRVARDSKAATQRTVVVQPKDRHLQRIEYRLYHDGLREMAVSYKRERVPWGYEGLLGRLKESYGQPAVENLEEYDPRPEVFSVRKTMWQDQATTMVLSESRGLYEGQAIHDLVLTITDRALQHEYEEEQAQQYRRRVYRVPIPLSNAGSMMEQTRGPRFAGAPVRSAGETDLHQ